MRIRFLVISNVFIKFTSFMYHERMIRRVSPRILVEEAMSGFRSDKGVREFGFGSAMDDHSYRSREAEGMTRHERPCGETQRYLREQRVHATSCNGQFTQPRASLHLFRSYSSISHLMGLTPLANAAASSLLPSELRPGDLPHAAPEPSYLMTQSLYRSAPQKHTQDTDTQSRTFRHEKVAWFTCLPSMRVSRNPSERKLLIHVDGQRR